VIGGIDLGGNLDRQPAAARNANGRIDALIR